MKEESGFQYRAGQFHCERVPLADIARQAGTPCYVYSARLILDNYQAYARGCAGVPHTVHYSVKANSSLGVLGLLARQGAGFDIVSGGELYRVLRAGGDPSKIVFSGVGKTAEEIDSALEAGIAVFNVESEAELELVEERAAGRPARAPIALRLNPDVSAQTHPYIATGLREHKFGVAIGEAEALYRRAAQMPHLAIEGVSCHIGSQIFDIQAFLEALCKLLDLVETLRQAGISIRHLDLGGGLAVAYRPEETTPRIDEYMPAVLNKLQGRNLHLRVEPGRSIVAAAGILLTRVLYRKRTGEKEFLIVDAAMNDLIRPALYESYHDIVPVKQTRGPLVTADVVGPVCETGDFLARGRQIPQTAPGDLLALLAAGAYGFVLSSNYNARPRAAEVLVEGDCFTVIRDRETCPDLVRGERTV